MQLRAHLEDAGDWSYWLPLVSILTLAVAGCRAFLLEYCRLRAARRRTCAPPQLPTTGGGTGTGAGATASEAAQGCGVCRAVREGSIEAWCDVYSSTSWSAVGGSTDRLARKS